MDNSLLAGIRVVDLSQFLPGPYATHLMVSLGASVLKIEPPDGDPMREILRRTDQVHSDLYGIVNAGKTIVRLDLKSNADRGRMTSILTNADVLLDGYRPGVLARLGFGADELLAINPGLIACSLSGYGQSGPYSQRAGHDVNYCSVAGLHARHQGTDAPGNLFPLLADHVGGMQAVMAILAALVRKARTGKGAQLDITLYETLLSWQYADQVPGFRSLLDGGAAYYNIYRSRDGRHYSLGAIEEKFWKDFCETSGNPDWIQRYHEPIPQLPLIGELKSWFSLRDSLGLDQIFEGSNFCLEKVLLSGEVLGHGQARHRKLVNETEMKFPGWIDGGPVPSLGPLVEVNKDEPFDWES